MISIPFKLFRIQQIDSQIDQAQFRCVEITQQLSENEELDQARQREQELQKDLEEAVSKLSHAENDVRQLRVKIETSEASLYGGRVQNPKELQDLQKEIASLKRYQVTLEDRQLEAMIYVDDTRESLLQAQKNLEKLNEEYLRSSQILRTEKEGLLTEINHLKNEKEAAITGLPENALNLYETLRKQRRGVAVSGVINNSCTACGTTINASLLQAASLPGQIARCETCGRILYAG